MASSSSKKLANAQAASLAAQVANMAAQLDFQKERMRLLELPQFSHLKQMDIDKLAFEKSQATWENALKEATLTGTYQGQPTLQWMEQQAKLFGVINGQQTLEGKLTDAQIAQINHAMQVQSHQMLLEDQKFGFERERWGKEFDYQMQKDLRDFGISEAQITGMYNGQQTLASKQLDSENTQAYLSLLGSLQGPGNAFKQMRVLGSTPQGLKDMVGQWTGQYQAAGLTGTGQAPGQAQVSDLFDQSYGQQFMGQQPGGPQGLIAGQAAPGMGTVHPQYGAYPGGTGQTNGPAGTFNYNDARSYSEAVRLAQGLPPLLTSPPPLNESPGYGPDATRTNWQVAPDPSQRQITPVGSGLPPGQSPAPAGMSEQIAYGPAVSGVEGERGAQGAQAPAGEQGYNVSPAGTQAPIGAYNYEATPSGQTQVYPPGVTAPQNGAQVSTTTPTSMSGNVGLLPSQINAENYENSNEYAKEFMWGYLENQGWDKMAAQSAYQKSLPRYGGPAQGTVNASLGF